MQEKIGDRRLAAGVDHRAAMLGGQERRVPVLHFVRGQAAMVWQHDEGRQIIVHRAEAVANPAARAREAGKQKAGRLQQRGRAVDAGFADHIVDESDVVHDLAEPGYRFA